MNSLNLYRDQASGDTPVPNRFIDEYLAEANDAQIKVYLYLLRAMEAGIDTDISDMADRFNYTEKDIIRALRFWEKQHLLSIEYTSEKDIAGIRFEAFPNSATHTKASIVPLKIEKNEPVNDSSTAPEKPNYSLDQLSEFKRDKKIQQLLFVAEQYIKHPLKPDDIRTIFYLIDSLHFSNELVDYLIASCVDRGKKNFAYIEKVGIDWAICGVNSVKMAESSLRDKKDLFLSSAPAKKTSSGNKFNSYIKGNYDIAALEKEILSN